MQKLAPGRKEVYYTVDHEWIHYQGARAYIGICAFKLTGYKKIDRIVFAHREGFVEKGTSIATIHYKDYFVHAHMPVDGLITHINPALVNGFGDVLLRSPEDTGWIACVISHKISDRLSLLNTAEYKFYWPDPISIK